MCSVASSHFPMWRSSKSASIPGLCTAANTSVASLPQWSVMASSPPGCSSPYPFVISRVQKMSMNEKVTKNGLSGIGWEWGRAGVVRGAEKDLAR